jgi:type I restriction enzyme S subunit
LVIGDGYRTKRSEHGVPGFRILRVADVADGALSLAGEDFVADRHRSQIGRKLSQAGDILLTTKGTVGRVAIVPRLSEPVVYSPQLCFFRVTDANTLHPTFLAHWFRSEAFRAQASHRMNNTDMAAYINLTDIRSLEISLPSVAEQRAIAEVLGALDDKIAVNREIANKAAELASLQYDVAFADVPLVPMSSVLTPILGGTPGRANKEFWGGQNAWASAKDVTGAACGVILATAETITDLATRTTKAKPLPVGSVILTARGTVGAVARTAIPCALNQSCYGFAPTVLPTCMLYFSVVRAAERMKELAHGSVFDTITMGTFDHLLVPDPESPVVAQAEASVGPLLDTVTGRLRESASLSAMRDTLLPELMSGRLRVRDAERVVSEAV